MMSFSEWKASRIAEVQGQQGDLALVGMYEINMEQQLAGIPGSWAPISSDLPGLMLQATASDQLYINGKRIEGQIPLVADETVITINERLAVTATYQPGSLHLLALWDSQSEPMRKFRGIDTFPYDESLVIEGTFIVDQHSTTFEFMHTGDGDHRLRSHQSLGEIQFQYKGFQAAMRPFASGDYMILVFRDATSGIESYGMGRMLLVEKPKSGNTVVLDFNASFLPPCAFSMYFNCPMPPASNVLDVAIKAGEKCVLWNDM